MKTGCAAWIYAGGAHHTCFSQNLTAEHLEDFASMANIEFVLIDKNTNLYQLKNELRWNEMVIVSMNIKIYNIYNNDKINIKI